MDTFRSIVENIVFYFIFPPFPLFFLSLNTCGTNIAHLSNPSDNNSIYSKCPYHSKFIVQCVIYLRIKNFTLQGQTNMSSLKEVFEGLPLDPLPPRRLRDESIAHAPVRTPNLTSDEQAVRLAIVNVIWELCIMFAGLLNFFVIKWGYWKIDKSMIQCKFHKM